MSNYPRVTHQTKLLHDVLLTAVLQAYWKHTQHFGTGSNQQWRLDSLVLTHGLLRGNQSVTLAHSMSQHAAAAAVAEAFCCSQSHCFYCTCLLKMQPPQLTRNRAAAVHRSGHWCRAHAAQLDPCSGLPREQEPHQTGWSVAMPCATSRYEMEAEQELVRRHI